MTDSMRDAPGSRPRIGERCHTDRRSSDPTKTKDCVLSALTYVLVDDAEMQTMVPARIASGVLAVFWGVLFFGVIDLAVVFQKTPGFYESYLLETGWGLLYTALIAAPLIVLALNPRMISLRAHIAVVAVCVAVTAIASFSWLQLLPSSGLLLTAVVIDKLCGRPAALSARGSGIWCRRALHRPLLIVACLAIPFSVVVAADLVLGFWQLRPPTDDDTRGIDHWPTQAALAIALPAVAILASLRAPGCKVSLWSAAVSAAWWGAVSVSYPEHAGSLGLVGGWVAIFWSIALMLSTAASPPKSGDRTV
jgi:hypothetical protein